MRQNSCHFEANNQIWLAIRNAVAIGVAGIVAAGEDVIDDPYGIGDIEYRVTITISGFNRKGEYTFGANEHSLIN